MPRVDAVTSQLTQISAMIDSHSRSRRSTTQRESKLHRTVLRRVVLRAEDERTGIGAIDRLADELAEDVGEPLSGAAFLMGRHGMPLEDAAYGTRLPSSAIRSLALF